MAPNTLSDSKSDQDMGLLKSLFSELLGLHDATWANLSKAKSVAISLIADDHASILNEAHVINLLSVIEDLVDSAMGGVEKNWALISQYKKMRGWSMINSDTGFKSSDVALGCYTIAAMGKAIRELLRSHRGSESDDELVSADLNLDVLIEKAMDLAGKASDLKVL